MAQDPEAPQSRWALVVATSTYEDPGLTQLRAPAADAKDIAEVLGDPRIGGFAVIPVLDQPEHQVRRRVDDFLASRNTEDLVLVYLSCHGVLDARGRLFFATTDTVKARLASTALSSAWLQELLEECPARRQVLVLDCCFSGAFGQAKGDTEIDLRGRLAGSSRGRVVLTASRAGEYSFEGKPLPEVMQAGSLFTAALVDGLRSGDADLDQDGWITVDEAFTFAANRTAASGLQNPQRYLHAAEGAIVLARNPNDLKVKPAELPEAIRLALDSPLPQVRQGAVAALGSWLASDDRSRVQAARQTLELVAAQDIPAVGKGARELLSTHEDAAVAAPAAPPVPVVDAGQGPNATPDKTTHPTMPRDPKRTISRGHAGWFLANNVNTLAFSPDGRLLASGGGDGMVRLWDPGTGKAVGRPLAGHNGWVSEVAFSPDGRLLASGGGYDKMVRLWDPAKGEAVGLSLTGHTMSVRALAFRPVGRLLASGGGDFMVRLWDWGTCRAVGRPLTGHTARIWALAFSPDGRLLASGGDDKVVRLWDPAEGEAVGQPLAGHTGGVGAVAFSPDGRLLASGGGDRVVLLWDPSTGEAVGQPLVGHTGGVEAVAFSPDGRLLASGGGDGMVRLWDPATGRAVGRVLAGHKERVRAVAFSPDGRLLASAGHDKTIKLWAMG